MPQGRITKKAIDELYCPEGKDRVFLWDNSLSGFGVAVFPTGRKAYVAQYRQAGRSRRIVIGDHGRLTPDEARSEAKKILGSVEKGNDPIEDRRAARAVRTFGEIADDYMSLHVNAKKKSRTQEEYARILRLYLKPAFRSKRIIDIRRSDVAKFHSGMKETPRAANHALALFSAIWNWAAKTNETVSTENPARSIEKFKEIRRERFLSMEELSRLGIALSQGETTGIPWEIEDKAKKSKHLSKPENRFVKLDPYAVAAIRLLILTGARLREILNAEWSQVDLERGILFLADSKTGKKPVYLSAAAQNILSKIKKIKGNPYVIAGAKDNKPRADLKKPWAAVQRASNLKGVRLHDLRHSFASFGAGASLGLPIIGKLLGHTQAATTARYAHLDADPLRRAVDTIGATISAAMDRKQGADILPLRQRNKKL